MVALSIALDILVLLGMASLTWGAYNMRRWLASQVEDAISQEIRRQDDRIEKRLQRAQGHPEDIAPTESRDAFVAGRPFRLGG